MLSDCQVGHPRVVIRCFDHSPTNVYLISNSLLFQPFLCVVRKVHEVMTTHLTLRIKQKQIVRQKRDAILRLTFKWLF